MLGDVPEVSRLRVFICERCVAEASTLFAALPPRAGGRAGRRIVYLVDSSST